MGIADRAYPGDIGLTIIRMDGILRRNARSGIGELVKIRRADIKGAKKVVIAPARKGVMIRASSDIFKQGLLGRALVKGDIVALGGTTRRRTTFVHSPFEEIFKMLDEVDEDVMGLGFSDIKFIVIDTLPKGSVIITDLTEVVFNPEAADMVEEPRLDITYEDIGGLSEEIKKVREMVELPLKHPEIFERLGIDAPKGVLLHGPPGTGKTLVAKAVANETNAYFTHINGPEIMSKFYGQSLPADEKILISDKGMFRRVPIGEVVDNGMEHVSVVCFDEEGKVKVNKVTGLIKHKLNSKILKVMTRSGREIRVTDYHSLFSLGKNGIESIKTSELKVNESFVAVPKTLPFTPDPIYKLNLLEMLKDDDFGLRVRNVQQFLREAVDKLGLGTVASVLNIREKYVYDLRSKNVGIKVNKFMKLMAAAKIEIKPEFVQLFTKGKSIPAEFIFSENFWTFAGFWMAEGSYMNPGGVRLSIHRREEKVVADLCRSLFGDVTIYRKPNSLGSDVLICSTAVKILMKDILGFASGARKKLVPDIVYNIPRPHLAAFLRGFISGDGSLNLSTPAPMVEISTESPNLADDLAYLMLMFGIVVKVYGRKNRPQKRLCFADHKNLELFLEIGFLDSERNSAIALYVSAKKWSRRDRLPLEPIKEIVKSHNLTAWNGLSGVGNDVLARLEDPRLKVVLGSDIYWDKVIAVEEVADLPNFVYDISVEPSQNFIAGFGGIFAHNSEQNLRKKFEEAEKSAPAIIFIDEIDAIASKREELHGEVERRVVAQLLALMDGLKDRGKVVVIAATNVPNLLDPALRRPGRFDREIEIGVPSKEGRLDILKIHTRNMPLGREVSKNTPSPKSEELSLAAKKYEFYNEKEKEKFLTEFAAKTHGFVGADLSMLCKEAAMVVLRRELPGLKFDEEEPIPKEVLERMVVTRQDFAEALKVVRPSAMREVLVEIPTIRWKDIGGLDEMKQQLKEAVEWPIKNPEAFKRLGVRPPKGILLYGAPGTGKTLLAKAVATESEANFILVKGPELLSKWLGESEKAVREIFKKARQTSPTIIFFDELDSLTPKRGVSSDSHVTERVVNQLLTEIDGLEDLYDTVIIGATNRPDMIDPALLRPGRFDRLILTPVPDVKSRYETFKVHTRGMPITIKERLLPQRIRVVNIVSKMASGESVMDSDVEMSSGNFNVEKIETPDDLLKHLADITEGYVGADIEAVCREAAILVLRKDIKSNFIDGKYFMEALGKVRPSVTREIEKFYEDLRESLSVARAKEIKEEKPTYMG